MYEPLKDETKELYAKIWVHFAIGGFNQDQLAALFNCSVDTVRNALDWSAERRVRFNSLVLVESAKEVLETKLRDLNNDLVKLKGATPQNWNAIIGMEKLILTYRDLLWKFQGVVDDRTILHVAPPANIEVERFKQKAREIERELTVEERAEYARILRVSLNGRRGNLEDGYDSQTKADLAELNRKIQERKRRESENKV